MDWQLIVSIASLLFSCFFAAVITLIGLLFKSYLRQFEEHKVDDELLRTRLHSLELAVAGKSVTREELKDAVSLLTDSVKETSRTLWDKLDSFEKVLYTSNAAERRAYPTK